MWRLQTSKTAGQTWGVGDTGVSRWDRKGLGDITVRQCNTADKNWQLDVKTRGQRIDNKNGTYHIW